MASMEFARPGTRDSVYSDTARVLHATMLAPENFVQRWDGNARTATEWNSLRKDMELWLDDGNCYVYLYQPGKSIRGPSFRVPVEMLVNADCNDLLDERLVSSASIHGDGLPKRDEECFLYLPAPDGLSRDDVFNYHIDTRNFFAWLVGAPIVGDDPLSALTRLKARLDTWRDPVVDNMCAVAEYIQGQGYAEGDAPIDTTMVAIPALTARPIPRRRASSLKSWIRRPNSTRRSSKVIDAPKKRMSILSFASHWGKTPEEPLPTVPIPTTTETTTAPVFEEDTEDVNRNSSTWSQSSPPQLSHSREPSIESFYSSSSDYASSPTSPTTPHAPEIPQRLSSFRNSTSKYNAQDHNQGGLYIFRDSDDYERGDTIEALIQEIEDSRRTS